jgi:uncharacterized protein YqgC (DUF456 family)
VEPTDTQSMVLVLSGAAVIIGVFGTVIPFVPGLVLGWLGVLGWALFSDAGPLRWVVLAAATGLALLGLVAKYAIPGRRMRRAGVPAWSLVAGGLLAIVGFFVVPVVGLVLGFITGVFLAELVRLRTPGRAWPSAWNAVKATGLSMLIEIAAALLILLAWVSGVAFA